MTDILGETGAGRKITRRDPSIRLETVIYDIVLTLSLPVPMTMTSALNAIAHSVEAFYAPDTNPIIDMMGSDAMRAFKAGLPLLKSDPQNKDERAQVLDGAWLCSTALGHVSMALHHKLCHTRGGSFGTPHAETHAILLPVIVIAAEANMPWLSAIYAHGTVQRALSEQNSCAGVCGRLASQHEQAQSLLVPQDQPRNHPPGGYDVCPVPSVPAQCVGPPA
ncbi:MAG: hypothetical protein ACOH2H_26325 [Cypionkella sp.]